MRLFIGLELPDPIKDQLLACQGGIPGARWQNRRQLHLTLNFIGQVADDQVPSLQALVSEFEVKPVTLQLQGVGHFGNRAVWVGITPVAPLQEVQQRLADALEDLGLDLDHRPYRPHITVARLRGQCDVQGFLDTQADFQSKPFEFRHASLFSSTPAPGGSAYEVIARSNLGDSGAAN